MVFPLSMRLGANLGDMPMTPEVMERFLYLKYLTLLMWVVAILRFLSADIGGFLGAVFSALAGVFLLKDDETFVGCWNTVFKDGCLHFFYGGGLNCLPYCVVVWGFLAFMDFMLVFDLIRKLGSLLPCTFSILCFEPIVVLCGAIVQFVACYHGWQVIKMHLQTTGGGQPLEMSPTGGYRSPGGGTGNIVPGSGAGGYLQNGVIMPGGSSAQNVQQQMFGGQGQRLDGGIIPAGGGGGGSGAAAGAAGGPTAAPLAQPMLGGGSFQPFAGSGQRLGDTSSIVFAGVLQPANAMHVSPCHLGGVEYAPRIRLTRVEHSPSVIRTAQPLEVKLFGISNERIGKLGKFQVDVFFCRRHADCMSVYGFEGDLCSTLVKKAESPTPTTSSSTSGQDAEDSSCALDFFEPFELHFEHPTQIPATIFRGSYDLRIQLEDSCFWVSDVIMSAGEWKTMLVDYRDVILAFIVASSSSYVLGQYINPLTGGLLPEITGFLLMGIVLGPFGTNLLSRFAVFLIQRDLNRICLSFIAITAGLEVYWPKIKNVYRSVFVLVVCIAAFTMLVVGLGGFFLFDLFPYNAYDVTKPPGLLACVLVGAIMVARSPTTLFAVCNQLNLFEIAYGSAGASATGGRTGSAGAGDKLRIVLVTAIASDLAVLIAYSMVSGVIRVLTSEHGRKLTSGGASREPEEGGGNASDENEADVDAGSEGSSGEKNGGAVKEGEGSISSVGAEGQRGHEDESAERETDANSKSSSGSATVASRTSEDKAATEPPIIITAADEGKDTDEKNGDKAGTSVESTENAGKGGSGERKSSDHGKPHETPITKTSNGGLTERDVKAETKKKDEGEKGEGPESKGVSAASSTAAESVSHAVLPVGTSAIHNFNPVPPANGEANVFGSLFATRPPPPKPIPKKYLRAHLAQLKSKQQPLTAKEILSITGTLTLDLSISIGGSVLGGLLLGVLFRFSYRKFFRSAKTRSSAGAYQQLSQRQRSKLLMRKSSNARVSAQGNPLSGVPDSVEVQPGETIAAPGDRLSAQGGTLEEDSYAYHETALLYQRIAGQLQRRAPESAAQASAFLQEFEAMSDGDSLHEDGDGDDAAAAVARQDTSHRLTIEPTPQEQAQRELGVFFQREQTNNSSSEGVSADRTGEPLRGPGEEEIGGLRATFQSVRKSSFELAGAPLDGAGGAATTTSTPKFYFRAMCFFSFVFFVFEACDRSSEATHGLLRLEPLLICSILACVVGHDAEIRAEIAEILTAFTTVVFLPFFTVTGASLRLLVMYSLFDTALVVFFLRFLAIFLASAIGGRFVELGSTTASVASTTAAGINPPEEEQDRGKLTDNEDDESEKEQLRKKEEQTFRTYLGFTMLSQAGVALGLALETVAIFPQWGQEICDVVIAVVCINQLVGPVFAVFGLRRLIIDSLPPGGGTNRTSSRGEGGGGSSSVYLGNVSGLLQHAALCEAKAAADSHSLTTAPAETESEKEMVEPCACELEWVIRGTRLEAASSLPPLTATAPLTFPDPPTKAFDPGSPSACDRYLEYDPLGLSAMAPFVNGQLARKCPADIAFFLADCVKSESHHLHNILLDSAVEHLATAGVECYSKSLYEEFIPAVEILLNYESNVEFMAVGRANIYEFPLHAWAEVGETVKKVEELVAERTPELEAVVSSTIAGAMKADTGGDDHYTVDQRPNELAKALMQNIRKRATSASGEDRVPAHDAKWASVFGALARSVALEIRLATPSPSSADAQSAQHTVDKTVKAQIKLRTCPIVRPEHNQMRVENADEATDHKSNEKSRMSPAAPLICAVPLVWPAQAETRQQILRTWGSGGGSNTNSKDGSKEKNGCDKLLFFVSVPDDEYTSWWADLDELRETYDAKLTGLEILDSEANKYSDLEEAFPATASPGATRPGGSESGKQDDRREASDGLFELLMDSKHAHWKRQYWLPSDVVDLRRFFPYDLPADASNLHYDSKTQRPSLSQSSPVAAGPAPPPTPKKVYNTQAKMFLMYSYIARFLPKNAWVCRLDRDTYFIPEHFKKMVRAGSMDVRDDHFLGHTLYHASRDGQLPFQDGGPATCFSNSVLRKLSKYLKELRTTRWWARDRFPSAENGLQPGANDLCKAFFAGHQDDRLLGACMGELKIRPDKLNVLDSFGRDKFVIASRPFLYDVKLPLVHPETFVDGARALKNGEGDGRTKVWRFTYEWLTEEEKETLASRTSEKHRMSVPVAPPAFASSPGTTRLMESIATLQNYYEAHGSSTKSTTDQPEDASFATNPVGDYCLRKYGDGELEGDRDRDKPAPSKQISKPCFESSELFAAPKPGVKAPRYHLETDSDSEHEGLLLRGQEEKILDSPVRAVVVDEKAADDKTPPFSAYAESKYERSKASKSTSGGASAAAMDLLLREEEDEGAVGILADAAAPSAEIKSHQSGADKEDGKAAEAPVTSAAADVSKITTPRNKPAAGTSASPAIKRTSHELEKDPVFPSPSREEILSAEQVCKQIESLHLAVDAEGTGKLFAAVSLLTSLQEKEAKKKQDLLSYYEAKCKRLEAEMLSASVENGAFAKNSFAQFEMERGVYEKRIAELERRSEDFEEVAQRQANLLEAAESELAVLRRRCAKQDEDVARLEGQCRRQLSDFRKVKFAPPLRSGAGEQAEAPAVRDLCDEVNELCDQVAGTVPTIPAADRSVHEPVEESGSSFLDNVDVSKVEHVSEVVDGTRELRSGTDVIDDVGAARDHAQSPVAQSQLERSFQRHKERIHAMRKTSADYSTSAEGKAKAKVHARREPSPGSGGKKSGVGRGAGAAVRQYGDRQSQFHFGQIVRRRWSRSRSEKIMWRLDNASATIREHPTGTCLLSPTFFYEPTPQSRIKIEFEFFPNGSDTSCSIFPAGTSAADCTSTNTVSPGSPPSTAEAMLMRFRERNQSILDKLASPPLAPSSEHGATGGGQLAGPMKASNGSASINTRIVRRRAGSASGGAAAPAASSSSNFSATLNGAPVYTNCSLQIRLFAPVATRFYAFLGNQKSEVQEGCGWRKKDKPFEVLCHFDRTGQIDGEDTLDVGVTLLLE
eukprot:g6065.t1